MDGENEQIEACDHSRKFIVFIIVKTSDLFLQQYI